MDSNGQISDCQLLRFAGAGSGLVELTERDWLRGWGIRLSLRSYSPTVLGLVLCEEQESIGLGRAAGIGISKELLSSTDILQDCDDACKRKALQLRLLPKACVLPLHVTQDGHPSRDDFGVLCRMNVQEVLEAIARIRCAQTIG